MKISGITIIKNALKYDYPVLESIKSILPIVDEMIICAGDSEDETNNLIASIGSEKIKIIHSVWDKKLREGGRVLAEETNKAMDAAAADADWLFYLQADEVIHEDYLPEIKKMAAKYLDDKRVEGLLFNYRHFYGSYKYLGDGRKWYSKEIRVIRNDKSIRSFKDAQGFRKDGRKLRVKPVNAWVFHYGWVKNPLFMQKKNRDFGQFWNEEAAHQAWVSAVDQQGLVFDYSVIDSLSLFKGTHPAVMKQRVENEDWNFLHDIRRKQFKNVKHRFLYFLDQRFGIRPFEYRNYKKI